MAPLSKLSSAVGGASDSFRAAMKRVGDKFSNIRRVPSRVGTGVADNAAASIKNDEKLMETSVNDAADTVDGLSGITSHPLGAKPDGSPNLSTTNQPVPQKDPTTEMPDGTTKTTARWNKIKSYVKGTAATTVLAGVGVVTFMDLAGVNLQNTDGVEVKITKIETVQDKPTSYKVTYATQGGQMCGPSGAKIPCIQNAFNPCKDDTFTFRNTHTTPTLDTVTAVVTDVDDNVVYFELQLTALGDGTPEWGFMTCHSSFENQFRGTVRDTVQAIAAVASDVANPLVGGICDALNIPLICPGGFDIGNWVMWVCAVLLCLCCLGISYALYTSFS